MKMKLHPAHTRGHADHGWLKANHSFSFASWYDPDRIQFGALRVLNDDVVAAGAGFPTHPHDNMEIITIPLSGVLEHQDSMGNKAQIKAGEIQVMSAGTGITHSEYNASKTEELRLFQIWLFPNKRNVDPRYDELKLNKADRKNRLQQILSPNENDDGVWIYQNAWMHMADLDNSTTLTYQFKGIDTGLYIMCIDGEALIEGQKLQRRDAVELIEAKSMSITTPTSCSILVIEVPL